MHVGSTSREGARDQARPHLLSLIGCAGCGGVQVVPALPPRAEARCHRCHKRLERTAGRSVSVAFACALGMLLLLPLAAFLPIMRVTLLGNSSQMTLLSTVRSMIGEDHVVVAVILAVVALLLPFCRALLLTLVLGALHFRRRLPDAGRVFRWGERLAPWAVVEVLFVALLVTYMRMVMRSQIDVTIGSGGYALVGAALLGFALRWSLDRGMVWRAIRPDPPLEWYERGIACDTCELVVPEEQAGEPCPRCARRLSPDRRDHLGMIVALLITCYVLFPLGYAYPMSHVQRPGGSLDRTIFSGIGKLFEDGYWYFALFFVVVSVLFPLVKVAGLTWIVLRIRYPAAKGLVLRTHLVRFIRGIGPWQFTDPLVVATTTPLISFSVAQIRGAPALVPFSLFVVCTMLAAELLDSRLMWRTADEAPPHG